MVPDRLAGASGTRSRHCICTASTRPAGFTTKWHVVPTNWYAARYLGFLARRAAGEGQFWRGSALGRAAFQTRETAESTRTTEPVTQPPYLIWPKVQLIGDRLGRARYRGDFRLAPSSCSASASEAAVDLGNQSGGEGDGLFRSSGDIRNGNADQGAGGSSVHQSIPHQQEFSEIFTGKLLLVRFVRPPEHPAPAGVFRDIHWR